MPRAVRGVRNAFAADVSGHLLMEQVQSNTSAYAAGVPLSRAQDSGTHSSKTDMMMEVKRDSKGKARQGGEGVALHKA